MEVLIVSLILIQRIQGLAKADLKLSQLCVNKNPGELVAHPENCRAYVVCSSDYEVYYCDSKYHFDKELKICNWPEFANCQLAVTEPTTTLIPPSKPSYAPFMALDILTGLVIDPLTSYDPQNVKCRHIGAYFLPHPLQCRSYFLCAYGHMHEHSCGPNTMWHYKLKQCVQSHKAICYNASPEEIQEIQEAHIQNSETYGVICYPVTPPIIIPNITVANTTSTTAFPALIPNTTVHTMEIHATTTTPPLSMLATSKNPHSSYAITIVCPHKKQSYVAHPKDCSKYFMCIMGNPVLTSCPPGLLWDSKKEFCNVARDVKCFE